MCMFESEQQQKNGRDSIKQRGLHVFAPEITVKCTIVPGARSDIGLRVTRRLPRKREPADEERMRKIEQPALSCVRQPRAGVAECIRSRLKENLSARLENRRCRTAKIRGNLKRQ